MITPSALNNLQWKAYLIFMVTNLAFIPLVYFCYPETSNLTLEEVDHLFTGEGSAIAKGRLGKKGMAEKVVPPTVPVMASLEKQAMISGGMDEEKGSGVEHVEG